MPKPVVYYDGACPVCAREIRAYQGRAGADQIEWQDVSLPAPVLAPDLTQSAALARLHVRRPDGTLVSGAAAFAVIWSSLPGLAWAGKLMTWPPMLWAAERGYRLFLRLRRSWRRGLPESS
jgi:predicted DCC family thiol-disulfide oxidoreductase YuxK